MSLLHRRRDLSHQALVDLCGNGNNDWFAEPFFGVRKLKLSKLLQEYDEFRYERAGPNRGAGRYTRSQPAHSLLTETPQWREISCREKGRALVSLPSPFPSSLQYIPR